MLLAYLISFGAGKIILAVPSKSGGEPKPAA
jgi:hypothetical protein